LERGSKVKHKNHLINIPNDQRSTEVRGDKTTNMSNKPFALNFHNDKKIVTVELLDQDGVFQLAAAFSKFLNENNIANKFIEQDILQPEQIQDANEETEDK
jgi:hypothetical protein